MTIDGFTIQGKTTLAWLEVPGTYQVRNHPRTEIRNSILLGFSEIRQTVLDPFLGQKGPALEKERAKKEESSLRE